MVRGFAVLLLMQFAGEMLCQTLTLPLPGNVVGLVLLLLAFQVGLMVYFDLLAKEWLPIVCATALSTFVVMAVTVWTTAWLEKSGGADE